MATERTVLVRLKANASDFVRGMGTAAAAVKGLRHEIDTTSDRTAWLAQSILALGPALVPLGAAAVPVLTGLATQLTLTGVAAGTLGLAFNGVGDALKALNDYQIDPTDAHLKKLNQTMSKIGPEGQQFVEFLDTLGPQLKDLSNSARQGLFPGMEEGITHLLTLLPQVGRIVTTTAETLGQLSAGAGKGLSGPRFAEFFNFLETDAKPILTDMAKTVGNFADGLAAMLVAFAPLSLEFSHGFEGMSKSFADWAHGLDASAGFQDFLAYIDENGPKALDLLGSMAGALIGIIKAAAPVGDVMLPVLTHFFDIIAKITDTPIGSMFLGAAAAASLYGRAVALASVSTGGMFKTLTPGLRTMNEQWRTTPVPTIRQLGDAILGVSKSNAELTATSTGVNRVLKKQAATTLQSKSVVGQFARSMGPTAAAVGLLGASMTGLDKKMGLTNATSLGLMGLMVGPWGGALGFAAGLTMDLSHANDGLEESITRVNLAAKAGDFSNLEQGAKHLKAQIDDMKHTTGFWDFLSDTGKQIGSGITNAGKPFASQAERGKAEDALANAKVQESSLKASASQDLLARGFETTATGARHAAESTADFATDIDKLNAALTGRATMRDYEQALDDFTKRAGDRAKVLDKIRTETADHAVNVANFDRDLAAARKTGNKGQIADIQDRRAAETRAHNERLKELQTEAETLKYSTNIDTQAGRDTMALLDGIASNALKLSQSLDAADRAPFLDAARQQFIKAAREAGMTRKEARALADEVLGLDNVTGHPKIVMDADGALHVVNDLQRRMNALHNKKLRIDLFVNQAHANAVMAQIMEIHSGKADGGTVPGSRYPYRDSKLVPLAGTEEIISNRYGQADKNRAALKAANAGATLAVVGYADGGTVPNFASFAASQSAVPATAAASGFVRLAPEDVGHIAKALLSARSVYGDAHFYGDHTQWRRQMEQDQQAAGIGGIPV